MLPSGWGYRIDPQSDIFLRRWEVGQQTASGEQIWFDQNSKHRAQNMPIVPSGIGCITTVRQTPAWKVNRNTATVKSNSKKVPLRTDLLLIVRFVAWQNFCFCVDSHRRTGANFVIAKDVANRYHSELEN